MEKNIDLQCHTTASDGRLSPSELVELAIKKNLAAIAVTDHDTIDGIDEALSAAMGKNIEIILGVEISCDDDGFIDTHILGLFIDHKNENLNSLLEKAKKYREQQKKSIIKKFQALGFKITYNEVKSIAKGEIGRPHIAKIILKNNSEKAKTMDEVFDKYLAVGKQAFVERKKKISVKETIGAIHSAGGFAFIAHPGVYTNFDIIDFIKYFIENGGDGIETYYDCTQIINKRFQKIAKKYNLIETGGSDFHGRPDQTFGKLNVPYSLLENMKKSLKNRFF